MSGIIRKGSENKAKSFWCCCINSWFTLTCQTACSPSAEEGNSI